MVPKMSEIADQLQALIPSSLDNIVRKNRDQAAIRLSSDAEIAALAADIHGHEVKDVFDDWRLISLALLRSPGGIIILLGNRRSDGSPAGTSKVLRIDLASNLAVTQNSMYGLGQRGIGEPNEDQLIHLCAQLNGWGAGKHLGIPPFFF